MSDHAGPAAAGALEHAKRYFYEGLEHIRNEHWADAEAALTRSLAAAPGRASILVNLSAVLVKLRRFPEAAALLEDLLAREPDNAEALLNRGNLYREQGRLVEAVADFDRILSTAPAYAEAWINKGLALLTLRKADEAIACLRRGLDIASDNPEGWLNLGLAMKAAGQADEAISCWSKALALKPDYANALFNLANLHCDEGRHEAAVELYRRICSKHPGFEHARGALFHVCMKICDWADYDAEIARLVKSLESDIRVAMPYPLLAAVDQPEVHAIAAKHYATEFSTAGQGEIPVRKAGRSSRIRIGYFSPDFRSHAVSQLIAGLFETHDRSRFELHAFSFAAGKHDDMTARLQSAFHQFHDVRFEADEHIAALARSRDIDVAFDLAGYTLGSRPGIFARRAAPLQVNYLGYPGTMGASFIDYLVADPWLIPDGERPHYSEHVVYLPDTYQPNDRRNAVSAPVPQRRAAGLPDDVTVFACFNNNFKITPPVMDVWCRILQRVPGSVLWLLEDNAHVAGNLRREARSRGVDPARVIFAAKAPLPQHLARHRLADLFLDTMPYNAHTTASDALWAGLPVLTCSGRSFGARVAGSLLRAVGLPELITHTLPDYEERAVALAQNRHELLRLRSLLADGQSALFDTTRYTRAFERAIEAMVGRHDAGLPPADIRIP